jgi:hypothetical protein
MTRLVLILPDRQQASFRTTTQSNAMTYLQSTSNTIHVSRVCWTKSREGLTTFDQGRQLLHNTLQVFTVSYDTSMSFINRLVHSIYRRRVTDTCININTYGGHTNYRVSRTRSQAIITWHSPSRTCARNDSIARKKRNHKYQGYLQIIQFSFTVSAMFLFWLSILINFNSFDSFLLIETICWDWSLVWTYLFSLERACTEYGWSWSGSSFKRFENNSIGETQRRTTVIIPVIKKADWRF